MKRIEANVTTGEITIIDLTPEEIAEIESRPSEKTLASELAALAKSLSADMDELRSSYLTAMIFDGSTEADTLAAIKQEIADTQAQYQQDVAETKLRYQPV